mmetsp:Transcript_27135/g.37882  ORF Transcript_27135/g.37882 Transcript_27135/m.37882 type:complete len:276 (+) Transcript_27135:62-889(+)|eukprot:CAMPEP_0185271232 /NCGR_PEP_ID=MMETSP1359-20130426/44245_1 /TAXON_ID=552665 /ORGANISM="Bigelowiella longifila, Strain CCMP242" /LENGTH=275 /DNA_ID=CAMNT_0027863101 /DNA_START=37 /DNA_END=864 /DNA_ORIENTATION=+
MAIVRIFLSISLCLIAHASTSTSTSGTSSSSVSNDAEGNLKQGWMAYMQGTIPGGVQRITKLRMKWKVGESAESSMVFYSPWFGLSSNDGLSLIQLLNPWLGNQWTMFTEFTELDKNHHQNSDQYAVKPGQIIEGTLEYNAETDSYLVSEQNIETGQISSQIVPCSDGKQYRTPYVVYEKTFPCNSYPPDEIVTFFDIYAECDGTDCTNEMEWISRINNSNCRMKAKFQDQTTISITWNVDEESQYKNMSISDLFHLNFSKGWATARISQKLASL